MDIWTIGLVADHTDHFGEDAVYVLGLTETPDGSEEGLALIFQIAEPDREGSGYCLVAEPGQGTAYQGVASCELTRKLLRLRLTDSAASDLSLATEVLLHLDVSDDQHSVLERGLERVGIEITRRS